jgi:hypothetical protein
LAGHKDGTLGSALAEVTKRDRMWDGDSATDPEKESVWEGRRALRKEPLAARRVRCPAGNATACNQREKQES